MKDFEVKFVDIKSEEFGGKGTLLISLNAITFVAEQGGKRSSMAIADFSTFKAEITIKKALFFKKQVLSLTFDKSHSEMQLLSKSNDVYQRNIAELKEHVNAYNEEQFASYKEKCANELSSMAAGKTATVLRLLGDKYASQIREFAFSKEKSLQENKKSLDALVSKLRSDLQTQIRKEEDRDLFATYKCRHIEELSSTPSKWKSVNLLIAKGKTRLETFSYDSDKSFDENKSAFDSLLNDIKHGIAEKEKEEQTKFDAAAFDSYKASRITGFKLEKSYSTAVGAIINSHLMSINEVAFDANLDLEKSKQRIDDLFNELLDAIKKQILLEQLEENTAKFNKTFKRLRTAFVTKYKGKIGSAQKVYQASLALIEAYKFCETKDVDENVCAFETLIAEQSSKIDEAERAEQEELEALRTAPENPDENQALIRKRPKNAYAPFFQNPYFILGISATSTNAQALNVRDKVEKYAKLNITKALTSSYDLKNIERPSRDLSSVQAAIVSLNDTTHKLFWFKSDEYCKIWETKHLFSWMDYDQESYDLLIACYIHLLIKDSAFQDAEHWSQFLNVVNGLFAMKDASLAKYLIACERAQEAANEIDVASSFRSAFLKPLFGLLEGASNEEINSFCKVFNAIKKPCSQFQTAVIEALLRKVREAKASNDYLFDSLKGKKKTEVKESVGIIKERVDLAKTIKDFIAGLKCESVVSKRAFDAYKDIAVDAIVFLEESGPKDSGLPIGKALYSCADDDTKRRLRYTFGHDKLGVSESALSAEELFDLALKYYNGNGVTKNVYTAYSWAKKAADRGHSKAMVFVAAALVEGEGCSKNRALAKMYLLKAIAAGEIDALKLLKSLEIPHESYDLGYVSVSSYATTFVEVGLSHIAYVRLMTSSSYETYKNGGEYRYWGGMQTQTPARVTIPFSGRWVLVVDNDGDDMGDITSFSCRTRTVPTYY